MKEEIIRVRNTICNNMKKIYKLKLFEKICESSTNKDGILQEDICYYSSDKIVDVNAVAFMLFLEKKRRINWIKIGFIRDYFDIDIKNQKDISDFITDYSVFGRRFPKHIPIVMELFISYSNYRYTKNGTHEQMVFQLLDFYNFLGQEYLKCDREKISSESVDRFVLYMDMLECHVSNNLNKNICRCD